jgi:RHH-type transcriptional regulator, proline utilization regulon repressor / proline dehydrogenase / delta 1-pyrroline-5-carboxylate dehydrogenase
MLIMGAPVKSHELLARNWDAIDGDKYRDETVAVGQLLESLALTSDARTAIMRRALLLVRGARQRARRQGVVESFLQEFSLSTPEGLALMGIAEALLRTPDAATKDKLIAERVNAADWGAHLGSSDSLFVNASTWALMLTQKWGDSGDLSDGPGILHRLVTRLGEPVVRAAVGRAIWIMGHQFVLGDSIEAALARAGKENLLCSFDMLGEGARTAAEAERFEAAYTAAIRAVGATKGQGRGPRASHGISVKLSALSPRYEPNQEERVWQELYPRLLRLATLAAEANINFTLDAEEADRLILSLKLLDRLAREPALGDWTGLGLAVQAYQKRAPKVIETLATLSRDTGRRLIVRLVKGAYWDSEIKRAQIAGRPDYPVFTTKPATDLSYLACARALIAAHPYLCGQFATHNAHSLVAVKTMTDSAGVPVEFQRLHGMGEALYAAARDELGEIAVRTYAPVGAHQDLLPYLVRRLLENGANTSFVHQLLNEETPPERVVSDPLSAFTGVEDFRHPRIPKPEDMYGDRRNSLGVDVTQALPRSALVSALDAVDGAKIGGCPIIAGLADAKTASAEVKSPFDSGRIVGQTCESNAAQITRAFALARAAQPLWDAKGGAGRCAVLRAMADALEKESLALAALCVREAGKTWPDAISEVREAIDFCRYYGLLAQRDFGPGQTLKGPVGETNVLELHGRGVFVCISPWNFPLAIFTGQVAAALAAGNAVLAKPAEQTPLIAAEAVRLFHSAGLDPNLLHLLPGQGETVGAMLVAHPDLAGVAFTGGTATAQAINRTLAARDGAIVPFIAETGGLNAMFVDTTAQREQVIDDVITSAFGSAGQRCSALRLLFLPEETAEDLIAGIAGAMDTLVVGDPALFATDVGPVIDGDAKEGLVQHLSQFERGGKLLKRSPITSSAPLVFAPAMVEVALAQLPAREVFGPILHVVRYSRKDLEKAGKALAAKGYGLTLGIHSRLDSFVRQVRALVPAGNIYVNRSIIGAVVGVQPFGGEGLSGTGPKAGGPLALTRYAVERAVSINIAAQGGDPALLNL